MAGMFFVTSGSSETVRAKLKVSRPRPGTRSVRRLESLFRAEPNTAEYGWPRCAVKISLGWPPPREAPRRADDPPALFETPTPPKPHTSPFPFTPHPRP